MAFLLSGMRPPCGMVNDRIEARLGKVVVGRNLTRGASITALLQREANQAARVIRRSETNSTNKNDPIGSPLVRYLNVAAISVPPKFCTFTSGGRCGWRRACGGSLGSGDSVTQWSTICS